MPLVLVSILLPIVAGALAPDAAAQRSRALASDRDRRGGDYVWDGFGGRYQRLERALAFAALRVRLPLRCDADFVLDRVAARALHGLRDRRLPRRADARLRCALARARRDDAGPLPGARPARLRALLGSDARPRVLCARSVGANIRRRRGAISSITFAGGLTLLLATAAFGVIYGSTDVIGRRGAPLAGGWAPWIYAGFAFAFLGEDAGLAAPYVDAADLQRASLADGFGGLRRAVEGGTLRISRHRHGVAAGVRASVRHAVDGAGRDLARSTERVIALVQNDAKRIVAYSSLSHLGLIVLAIASGNRLALDGALVYIVAHGLFSAALFLVARLRRGARRDASAACGSAAWAGESAPRRRALHCGARGLGSTGLGGLCRRAADLDRRLSSGYVWPAIVALVAIVLASAYMLRLYQDIMNGPAAGGLAGSSPISRGLKALPSRRCWPRWCWSASIPSRSWSTPQSPLRRAELFHDAFVHARRLERDCFPSRSSPRRGLAVLARRSLCRPQAVALCFNRHRAAGSVGRGHRCRTAVRP